MNKRNIELAAEAGAHWEHGDWNLASSVHFSEEDLQTFADLIRADERVSAYQRGYLDGIGRDCPHCKDYKAMYIKVRDELAEEQQRNAT